MKKTLSPATQANLTAIERQRLDDVCDAFEAKWKSQSGPKIEDYLEKFDKETTPALFEELLKIELHWRKQASDASKLREAYLSRFPEQQAVIERVLGSDESRLNLQNLQSHTLGPFRDLEKIGDGGFGVVFRAWDSRHRRSVALKIPRWGHQLVGRELQQFLREAKAAGSLDHPNIARVWDSGAAAGVTYIAYQLIEGDNLKNQVAAFADRPPLQIVSFVRKLAGAVHYAHQRGIIHRDIKPSNVLLTEDEQPVLADFGLALAIGGDATRSLAGRIGTLDYMSPEQAMGAQEEVDQRADLWSLGVMLYELLTGQLPFHGASDIQLCNHICNSPHKSVRAVRRNIPRDLEIVVDACLQKRPSDRLASCKLLVEELERIETGRPIVSRRVSFVERGLRWCRRNPRPLVAFGAMLLATAFGTWSWGLRLAENRQNENVVQQLQLQLEVKNAERRELLSDLMRKGATGAAFLEQDLVFLEQQLFARTDRAEQLYCAEVLARNGRLSADKYAEDDPRRALVAELISALPKQPVEAERAD